MRRCCHRGEAGGKEGSGRARQMNGCSVVPLAAQTNRLNSFQWSCFAQRCRWRIMDTRLHGWDGVWVSGSLDTRTVRARRQAGRALFGRSAKQLPPSCKVLQGWAGENRNWGTSKSLILFHLGQICSCAAHICKAKDVHPCLCLCQTLIQLMYTEPQRAGRRRRGWVKGTVSANTSMRAEE